MQYAIMQFYNTTLYSMPPLTEAQLHYSLHGHSLESKSNRITQPLPLLLLAAVGFSSATTRRRSSGIEGTN